MANLKCCFMSLIINTPDFNLCSHISIKRTKWSKNSEKEYNVQREIEMLAPAKTASFTFALNLIRWRSTASCFGDILIEGQGVSAWI